MSDPDLEACAVAIRHGSKSFHAASRLLPPHVRAPALALYAFCRLADDAVDLGQDKYTAVERLAERLDAAYAGRPVDTPADRAFARMVEDHDMPRALPEALIEGFAWDAEERQYETLSDVRAYSARVAATVGAMMTVLMGVRDPHALARACDLGVAMQLTNIARDVGEDARAGRIYLPLAWMRDQGLDPDTFLAEPCHSRPLAQVVHRLLAEARRLYHRAETGIADLPLACRPAIFAARLIYAAIGTEVARADHDSITHRAHTGGWTKLRLAGEALGSAALTVATPRAAARLAPPLPETAFLVNAAAAPSHDEGITGAWIGDLFLQLEAHRRAKLEGSDAC
ncbi:MAG: phytoene/squalene synthase family protein [Pseudomonadota bacterium]